MSRIINVALVFIFALSFGGCATKPQPVLQAQEPSKDTTPQIKILQNKTDELRLEETALFMAYVQAAGDMDHKRAAFYMESLYSKYNKRQYLAELVKIYTLNGENQKAVAILKAAVDKDAENIDAKKMLAASYISQREFAKAFELSESIANKTKKKEDYDTVGSIAYILNDYKKALKFFRLSYSKKPDHITAERIATTMFLEGQGVEATAFLDTHIRMFGCSKYICEKLAATYIERGDQRGALETYKKLYFKIKEEKYIKKIIELSVAGSDIDGLIAFLKKTNKDDNLLFEAYKYKKDSKNAAIMASRLYGKTKDLNFLAQAVIYKFESYPEKKPLWLIKECIKDLSVVTNGMQNDLYDNYLGYLLIDYNVDIQRGIDLVKRALSKEPNSLFYKDSLAWGYYKQKKCAEAYELMKSVAAELKDDKTVMEHYEAIKKCIQGQK